MLVIGIIKSASANDDDDENDDDIKVNSCSPRKSNVIYFNNTKHKYEILPQIEPFSTGSL